MNRWLKGLVLLLQIGGGVCGFFLIGRSLLAGDVTQTAMIIHAVFMIIFAFTDTDYHITSGGLYDVLRRELQCVLARDGVGNEFAFWRQVLFLH